MQLDYESGHADLTTADCNSVYFPSHIPRRIIGVYSHMKTNSRSNTREPLGAITLGITYVLKSFGI